MQDDTQSGQAGTWSDQPVADDAAVTSDSYLETPVTEPAIATDSTSDMPLPEVQAEDTASAAATPPSAPPVEPTATDTTDASAAPATTAGSDEDLLNIKQQALQQLGPLVGHLDQSPEDKFRTTMMMIQASDNKDLISMAYEAANQISDEKTRAQALLDIVNEINYFTQR